MTKPRKSVAFVPDSNARHDNAATAFVRLPGDEAPPAAPAPPRGPQAPPRPPTSGGPAPSAPPPEVPAGIVRMTRAEFGLRFYFDGEPLFANAETSVHVAVDAGVPEGVSAAVAVKHFRKRPDDRGDAWRTRLRREFKVLSEIRHAALPALRGAFETEEGGFLVIEMFGIDTLQSHVEKHGKLSVAQATQVMTAIGEAIEALHTAGLLHRDVRPSNIVVRPQPDGSLGAQLIDFDGVWFHDVEGTPPPLRLRVGQLLPPEVTIDEQAWTRGGDVFMWGHSLAFALTGNHELAAIAKARSPLTPIVTRACSANPKERPHSIRGALIELGQRKDRIAAAPSRIASRPWILIAGLGLCGVLTGIIVTQNWGPPPPPPGPRVVLLPARTGADAPPPPTPPAPSPLPGGFFDRLKLAEQRVATAMTMDPRRKAARIETLERQALELLTGALDGHMPVDEGTQRVMTSIRSEAWHQAALGAEVEALRTAAARGDEAGIRGALERLYALDPTHEGVAFARRHRRDTRVVWEDR
ncbi:protein kinase [Myxococcota bacterium]|nr:protein kinase [Myxococcota bacterium]